MVIAVASVDFRKALDKVVTVLHKTYNENGELVYIPIVFTGCQYLAIESVRAINDDGKEQKTYNRRCILSNEASEALLELDTLDGDYIVLGVLEEDEYSFDDIAELEVEMFKIKDVLNRMNSGVTIRYNVLDKYVSCLILEGDR